MTRLQPFSKITLLAWAIIIGYALGGSRIFLMVDDHPLQADDLEVNCALLIARSICVLNHFGFTIIALFPR